MHVNASIIFSVPNEPLTLTQTTNFRLFQIEDNFELDENGRKFSKQFENVVGKAKIARHEQFSFSQSVLKTLLLQKRKNQGLFEKGLNVQRTNTRKLLECSHLGR